MRLSAVCLVLATVAAMPAQASSFVLLPPAQSDPSITTIAPIPFARETFLALKAAGAEAAAAPGTPAANPAIPVAPSASMVVIDPLPLLDETRTAMRAASAASAANPRADAAPAAPFPVTPSASMVVLGDPAPFVDPTETVASIGRPQARAALPTVFRGGVVSTSASPPAIPAAPVEQTDAQSPEATGQPSAETEAATEAAPDASPAAAE